MADSIINHIDKTRIFRETFENEQSVRRGGGTITTVNFVNGIANPSATTARINYTRFIPTGTYSIRFKVKVVASFATSRYFFGTAGPTEYVRISSSGNIQKSTGTSYINGVEASDSSSLYNTWIDVCITGITLTNIKSWDLLNYPTAAVAGTDIYMEVFEIYIGTLTAQEVKNLYENKRYREIPVNTGEQLGSELVVNGSFADATGWTLTAPWTVSGGTANYDKLSSNAMVSTFGITITVGKRYRLIYTISGLTSGNAVLAFRNTANQYIFDVYPTVVNRTNGTWTETVLCTANGATNIQVLGNNGSGSSWSIDNLSIKEILVEQTDTILDVSANNGTICNRLSGSTINGVTVPTVTNTAMTVRKENELPCMDFNGSTSKIDCGSYDGLTGDKTIIAWCYKKGDYPSTGSSILRNGKTIVYCNSAPIIKVCSDGSTFATTANILTYRNTWYFVAVTRTSVGITNIYINGVLSGSANQSSGTPATGTTNIIVGNESGSTQPFGGRLNGVRVINGILTVEKISELYTSEKSKYGL